MTYVPNKWNTYVLTLEIGDRGMANDSHDSRRKDKLIMSHRISINIHKGENEVRGKVYKDGDKRESKKWAQGSVMELWWDKRWRTNVITMSRNLGPFAKPEHEVFWQSPHEEGVSLKRDKSSSLDTGHRQRQPG